MNKLTYGAIIIATFLIQTSSAHAYLDPATGSMILQALIGGVAAAIIFGKAYIYKIKMFFSGNKKEESNRISQKEDSE